MTLDRIGRQLQRPGLAQRLCVLVEAHKQTVLAHNGLEERVIGEHRRFEEHAILIMLVIGKHRRGDPGQQLARCLTGEGEAENTFGSHAMLDERHDATRHGVGFA